MALRVLVFIDIFISTYLKDQIPSATWRMSNLLTQTQSLYSSLLMPVIRNGNDVKRVEGPLYHPRSMVDHPRELLRNSGDAGERASYSKYTGGLLHPVKRAISG